MRNSKDEDTMRCSDNGHWTEDRQGKKNESNGDVSGFVIEIGTQIWISGEGSSFRNATLILFRDANRCDTSSLAWHGMKDILPKRRNVHLVCTRKRREAIARTEAVLICSSFSYVPKPIDALGAWKILDYVHFRQLS
jgi:hypothetical protein